jgi:hypothetical protein
MSPKNPDSQGHWVLDAYAAMTEIAAGAREGFGRRGSVQIDIIWIGSSNFTSPKLLEGPGRWRKSHSPLRSLPARFWSLSEFAMT